MLYLNDEGEATVYLVDTSGGMVSGDRNAIQVKVASSSTAHLVTQSSTKIYPSRASGDLTEQTIDLAVDDFASLYWHPETTIPFKDARFKQKITVSLKPSSTFYFADILSPGREKHDEMFKYEMVDTSIKIDYNGTCIAYDRQKLQPSSFSKKQLGLLDDCSYFGSAWFISPTPIDSLRSLQEQMPVLPGVRFSVTELDPVGLHARWLSKDLCLVKESMSAFYELINIEAFSKSQK
ncbi:urease accessory protein UreD [Bacillus solitudinis]|uniref:urease accessory protein UreD n=1 Tax=Bacillus solitudinis TaxID=2014074 RepID=UPI0012FD9287|nr:urease accessory protein UreD [Bacillus solitudinis]